MRLKQHQLSTPNVAGSICLLCLFQGLDVMLGVICAGRTPKARAQRIDLICG